MGVDGGDTLKPETFVRLQPRAWLALLLLGSAWRSRSSILASAQATPPPSGDAPLSPGCAKSLGDDEASHRNLRGRFGLRRLGTRPETLHF